MRRLWWASLACCSLFGRLTLKVRGDSERRVVRPEESRLLVVDKDVSSSERNNHDCQKALNELKGNGDDKLFNDISFALHRNGEPDSCGYALSSFEALQQSLEGINGCEIEKFDREGDSCGSNDNSTALGGFEGFCDMSRARTVKQPDYDRLDRLRSGSLPCRFYTREGLRIDSLSTLTEVVRKARRDSTISCNDHMGDQTCIATPSLHMYAVPAGRFFMFAPAMVGEKFVVDHVSNASTIVVETLSLSPRVFELYGFYSSQEAENLVDEALAETSETHKLHRSTTGATNGKVYSKRTSDNAWITDSELATRIKKRCLNFLGFDEFWRSHTDGLQVLRYQNGQAYVTHKDYLKNDSGENYDFDSSKVGGNRYATILLYMSEVESGGETVFEKAWPAGASDNDKNRPLEDTIRELRETGQIDLLKEGSWEESLAAMCRTRLVVKPKAGRAVLFYSQHPNGKGDDASLHGACPVLNGTKWAANLWVWNAPRPEYDGAPRLRPVEPKKNPREKMAVFTNTGKDPRLDKAELFWDSKVSFGKFGPNDPPIRVNTFPGHRWHVMVDGASLHEFVISQDAKQDDFQI